MKLLAVCHDCRKRHLIDVERRNLGNAVNDWQFKHVNHRIEYLGLNPVDEDLGGYSPNADIKSAFAASSAALTITLAALPTSATLVAGQESTAVDSTSNLYTDYLIGGKITTGTSPTTAKTIEVWAYGEIEDAPLYPDVLDGTDSAETITSVDIKAAILRPIAIMLTDATSDRAYWFGPVPLASVFGGTLPPRWGVFVVHDTGVNLNATGSNHAIYQRGQYHTA